MQRLVAEQVPLVFLTSRHVRVAARPDVRNVRPAVLGRPTMWNADELYNAVQYGQREVMASDSRADAPWEAERHWSDTRLVGACREGNEKAWAALIDKYQNLIFSIPIKYGFSRADAADIFQAVCVDLLTELPRLRNPSALPKWLMQTTAHRCWRSRRQEARYSRDEEDARRLLERPTLPETAPEALLQEVEREQAVREAIAGLPPRCRRMVEMLFYETPPRPYEQVAAILGVATGSIGFLRMRCLRRLRRYLEQAGL